MDAQVFCVYQRREGPRAGPSLNAGLRPHKSKPPISSIAFNFFLCRANYTLKVDGETQGNGPTLYSFNSTVEHHSATIHVIRDSHSSRFNSPNGKLRQFGRMESHTGPQVTGRMMAGLSPSHLFFRVLSHLLPRHTILLFPSLTVFFDRTQP